MNVEKARTYIGIVENNEDPKKLGRCRIRVLNVFDDVSVDDIPWATPWKDLNGNVFNVPEKGKIVTVVFDSGNAYKPEYIYADHYNVNLEKKLESLSGQNYTSMKALIFDHKTQVYVNDEEGLKLDHKFNMINITSDSINLNLADNLKHVNIGTYTANQQAILGNHFLDWFDEFISNLLGEQAGPYLGNLGAPVVANPAFIAVCQKYRALKDPKFLSHHVNIVDNSYVNKLDRVNDPQTGDNYKTTKQLAPGGTSGPETQKVDYKPQDGLATDTPATSENLTPAVSEDGKNNTIEQNSQAAAEQSRAVNPTTHPDLDSLVKTMTKLGYEIYTRPYEVNIVSIRKTLIGQTYPNKHNDECFVFYVDDNKNWKVHKFAIATLPGVWNTAYQVEVTDKKGNKSMKQRTSPASKSNERTVAGPMNNKALPMIQARGGLGILMEAQYKNNYFMSIPGVPDPNGREGGHGGHRAMKNLGDQKCYRDKTEGLTWNVSKKDGKGGGGFYAMYMHVGFPGGAGVYNWSEGCQVFRTKTELDSFFDLMNEPMKRYGNKFTYTLISIASMEAAQGGEADRLIK